MSFTYSITKSIVQETLCIAQKMGDDSVEYKNTAIGINSVKADRIPISTFVCLLRSIRDELNDPNIGIRLGNHLQINSFSLVGYLMMCSQTMRESIPLVEKFYCLALDVGSFSVLKENADVIIGWDIHCDYFSQERLFIDLIIAAMRRFGIWMTGEKCEIKEVFLQYKKPESIDYLKSLFPCPIRFNNKINGFRLSEDYLDIPIRTSDDALRLVLYNHAESSLRQLRCQHIHVEHVKKVMIPLLSQGRCSVDHVAQQLKISTRSLQRQLKQQGIKYKQLLQEIRLQQANYQLHYTQSSLSDVANMLGYAEQSAFSHAYKAWTGRSPAQVRKQIEK